MLSPPLTLFPQVMICDESHVLRTTSGRSNTENARTEACLRAIERARRAVLLSGTPSLSRPFDLFRQVDSLRKGLLGKSKDEFATRYCDRKKVWKFLGSGGGQGGRRRVETYSCGGGTYLMELHALLRGEVMIRRLKSEVLAELPPIRRQIIRLPPPRAEDWPKEYAG
jgi:SNF2 family DNA or RNA helicase